MPSVKKPVRGKGHLRGKKPGPFRGGTGGNRHQTLDIGSGEYPFHLSVKHKKFPHRQYAAADPKLIYMEWTAGEVFKKKALEALDDARGKGLRFRHINMDMPLGDLIKSEYLEKLFENAKEVLQPNGKIFISTERGFALEHEILPVLKKAGFSIGKIRKLHKGEWSKDMHALAESYERHRFESEPTFYRLEATYRLKTALSKRERKDWPK